jgi:hypothetical protein
MLLGSLVDCMIQQFVPVPPNVSWVIHHLLYLTPNLYSNPVTLPHWQRGDASEINFIQPALRNDELPLVAPTDSSNNILYTWPAT